MVGDESLQRCLHDLTDVEVELGGHCVEFSLIVVGDATNEVDGQRLGLMAPRGGEDVAQEELMEAVEEELMDGWMLAMPGTERAEGGKEAVG